MYTFVDTTEVSEGALLPSEALSINGEYIENQITGYRTLTVRGREALSPDVCSESIGASDGSRMKYKRYPERIITVKYQIIAKTNEEFRDSYNKLGQILNVENAQLIFNDEKDKYYIGTPCIIGEVPDGRNSVVAEFEILCTDPFKYSVIEYEATTDLDNSSILIDYNGTYKGFPTLRTEFYNEEDIQDDTLNTLTGNGDCGYVAFFNERGNIIQLGDPDEVDVTVTNKSNTLFNQSFTKSNSWGTATQSQWGVNSGITSSSAVEQKGTIGMGVSAYSGGDTSATLLNITSNEENPPIKYTVTAKTSNRTNTGVKVVITIKSALVRETAYIGNGYGLKGSVYIGGKWYSVALKTSSNYWRGTTVHTATINATVSGLTSSTTQLTGIKFKVERTDSNGGKTGVINTTNCSNISIATTATEYYLSCSNYSSGNNWHGASITRNLTEGATDFTLTYSQKMMIGNNATSEIGAFQVILTNGTGANRKILAGLNIYKSTTGTKAGLGLYLNGKAVFNTGGLIDLSTENKLNTTTITKNGNTVTFNVAGMTKQFTDDDITDLSVNEVTFTFTKYKDKTPLTFNGLYSAKLVKNNVKVYNDIPNKFSANDILMADCRNAEITLNGVSTPALGAVGNDWEEFYLTPGLNQIGVAYSNWVVGGYEPTMKVRYREVFL